MYETLKSFILNNWKDIVLFIFALINIIVLCTKKKVKVIDVMAIVLKRLPGYILDAEHNCNTGESRYTEVFSRIVKDLVDLTGLTSEQVCDKYTIQINDAIENNVAVLNDFKKGEKNGKV